MDSDIAIAQRATMRRIADLAQDRLGIDAEHLVPYGHYKAKISLDYLKTLENRPDGKLVLVTAISPTPAGEGKTTTTVGLTEGLNRIGRKAALCVREPSLGPCFGVKGGAAGGGYSQVVPMEDINLHFTGDFHAIGLAHNLLAALLDNHVYHGNELGLDLRRISWRRVMDMNDRALRQMVVALGGAANGYPREDGFDITVASEIMAMICLVGSVKEMKQRIGNIVVGYTRDRKPVYARDLKAPGAMAALLKDALAPNLVQTLENNPAFIHGGPFGNIAHGCNSLIATKAALKLSDIVVTEAGFGADLGAEKFVNIKCRKSGLRPSVAVVVATARALKFHGGVDRPDLNQENVAAIEKGFVNLERHLDNVRNQYGLNAVICVNRFVSDTNAELNLLRKLAADRGVEAFICTHWADGGKGAEALAQAVAKLTDGPVPPLKFLYQDGDSLESKVRAIAQKVYRAADIGVDARIKGQFQQLTELGYGHLPICMAKTQYSFSHDPSLRGAPTGFTIPIRDLRLAAGAEFVVVVCGDIMTMPGLPKTPAANAIDVDDQGRITGLF